MLNFYPKDFKVDYKDLLMQIFKNMLRDAYKLNKIKEFLNVWLTFIKDLLVSVINEHLLLGSINMKKFWKSFAIIFPSLLAFAWALGVGRFYLPIIKSFFSNKLSF